MHLNDFECPSITIKGLPTSTANGKINTTPSNARLVGGIDNGRLMWVWRVKKIHHRSEVYLDHDV